MQTDNIESTAPRKPRLIFFQYKYDERLPVFLLAHKHEQVKCLSESFEVTVIDKDCDYRQICESYHPDVTLFESAFNVSFSYCRRPTITNVQACAQVPKLGFLHSDSFSQGRAGFLSDMDHWGIETFFSIATTAPEHMPEISQALFIWPNFIDAETYYDYHQWKNIPVLFTGNRNALYPWRHHIMRLVSEHYPSLICPHPGFAPLKTRALAGESYARMINASWFVPACGTVAKEIVRKHFEVPACKACLITEQSPALEAAGFIDMANCVFADGHDILDKLAYLFANRDVLDRMIDAGHQLVHSRHTLKHRDQIVQWFKLKKYLKASQRIVQDGPFAPLRVVDSSAGLASSHIVSNGLDLMLLRQGDKKLWRGDYAGAESLYLKCLNYVPWMPEPQLRLALCNLYKGDAEAALFWVLKPLDFTLLEYKAVDPDPVEWAYYIISLLCAGKVSAARKHAGQFEWLRHPELDRARQVVGVLTDSSEMAAASASDVNHGHRVSIHQLPERSIEQWAEELCKMLAAAGQFQSLTVLRTLVVAPAIQDKTSGPCSGTGALSASATHNHRKPCAKPRDYLARRSRAPHSLYYRATTHNVCRKVKNGVVGMLRRLKRKVRYLLPHAFPS